MRNLLILAALLTFPAFSFSQTAKDFKCCDRKDCYEIPLGTPIYLEARNTINADEAEVGDLVEFKVRTDVIVGGTIVIATGALAQGVVTDASAANLNMPGKLILSIDQVQAVDGQWVKLSSNQQTIAGKARAESAELKPGRVMTAEVASNKAILLK